jgi:hypothetical protein
LFSDNNKCYKWDNAIKLGIKQAYMKIGVGIAFEPHGVKVTFA